MATYNSHLHIVTWLKGVLPYLSNEYGVVPKIKTLAEMKGCSDASMHKAIKKLEMDGFLLSKRGYGTCLRNSGFHVNTEPNKDIQEILSSSSVKKSKPKFVLILPVYNYVKPYPNEIAGYISDYCQGAFDACEKYNLEIVIRYFDLNLENRSKSIRGIIAYIKKSSVSGVISCGVIGHDLFGSLYKLGLPCLIVDHWPLGLHLPSLNPNHFDAAKELVFVLASLKHKNIALIDRVNIESNPKILSGFKAGLEVAQLNLREDLLFNVKMNFLVQQHEASHLHFEELLKSVNRPTAFITYSSEIAIELVKFLERLGLKVPQDVSIISFCSSKVEINGVVLSGIFYDWKSIGTVSINKILSIYFKKDEIIFDDYFKYTFLPGSTISYNSYKP